MSELNQQFDTFDQWVNKASSWLTRYPLNADGSDPSGMTDSELEAMPYKAICFDALGRVCSCGRHFMRARDENAFPVRWLWPHQIAPMAIEHDALLDSVVISQAMADAAAAEKELGNG